MIIREQAPDSPPLAPLDGERAARVVLQLADELARSLRDWVPFTPPGYGSERKETEKILRALAARLPGLLKDGERLDWLEAARLWLSYGSTIGDAKWSVRDIADRETHDGPTVRDAIDAARAPSPEPEKPT